MQLNAPAKMGELFGVVFLVGIALIGCAVPVESRAVNISNTWTLPQEGFSVFYRYFRDKISWFEADAVCQFHHANLVTVDNGVQFDATRAFLKELDVTSAVWIGLMRPENSARFTWTSSKALDPTSGYWAEAIPAMEQPLCAVVDPVRDFRWHALRCGGPETAAFLCELPVPAWAVDCTVTSIPSLTVQYMSDSGTVQLSRDCGESGTKHISCQGKQDRDSIVEQLQCSDEEDLLASVLATENNNALPVAQLPAGDPARRAHPASQHVAAPQQPAAMLEHDILTVVSSNDEDSSSNNIEVNPNQIEDTVKNVINKFNLQDLMRSEQAAALHSDEAAGGGRDSLARKPTGPYGKKYSSLLHEKKAHAFAKKLEGAAGARPDSTAEEDEDEDEPMMGDQPLADETETQPIDIVQQAVRPTADGDYTDPGTPPKAEDAAEESKVRQSSTELPEGSTPDSRLRRATDSDSEVTAGSTEPGLTTEALTTVPPTTPTPIASTSAPPTLPTTRTTAASHVLPTTPKKDVITGDHFIPPMLLVKARFISARPHTEPPATTMLPTTFAVSSTTAVVAPATTLLPPASEPVSEEQPINSTDEHHVVEVVFEPSDPTEASGGSLTITTRPSVVTTTTAAVAASEALPNATTAVPPQQPQALVSILRLSVVSTLEPTTEAAPEATSSVSVSEEPRTSSGEGSTSLGSTPETVVTDGTTEGSPTTLAAFAGSTAAVAVEDASVGSSHPAAIGTTNPPSSSAPTATEATIAQDASTLGAAGSNQVHEEEPAELHLDPAGPGISEEEEEEEHQHQQHSEELHNSFSNVENYQPYKPNRHRSLTKPEVHNNHGAYIKKILG